MGTNIDKSILGGSFIDLPILDKQTKKHYDEINPKYNNRALFRRIIL